MLLYANLNLRLNKPNNAFHNYKEALRIYESIGDVEKISSIKKSIQLVSRPRIDISPIIVPTVSRASLLDRIDDPIGCRPPTPAPFSWAAAEEIRRSARPALTSWAAAEERQTSKKLADRVSAI